MIKDGSGGRLGWLGDEREAAGRRLDALAHARREALRRVESRDVAENETDERQEQGQSGSPVRIASNARVAEAATMGNVSQTLRETDAVDRWLDQAREEIKTLFASAVAAHARAEAIQKRLDHEIGQRQRAEAALADSERRYRSMFAARSEEERATADAWKSPPRPNSPE
jgi:hypothetical protein